MCNISIIGIILIFVGIFLCPILTLACVLYFLNMPILGTVAMGWSIIIGLGKIMED